MSFTAALTVAYFALPAMLVGSAVLWPPRCREHKHRAPCGECKRATAQESPR